MLPLCEMCLRNAVEFGWELGPQVNKKLWTTQKNEWLIWKTPKRFVPLGQHYFTDDSSSSPSSPPSSWLLTDSLWQSVVPHPPQRLCLWFLPSIFLSVLTWRNVPRCNCSLRRRAMEHEIKVLLFILWMFLIKAADDLCMGSFISVKISHL